MKKALTSIGLVAVLAAGAMTMPAAASAASTADLARAECRADKLDDPREFNREHGTISNCVKNETRQARRECKADRRFETAEFRAEYGGTGKKALRRCIRDELR